MMPENFVEDHIEDARDSYFYMVPLQELSKDELMCSVFVLGEALKDSIKRNEDVLSELSFYKRHIGHE